MRIPNSIKLAWRNLKVNIDPASLVIIIGLPAMYLLLMGTMFVAIIPSFRVGGTTFTYISFLTPGIVGFQTVMAGTIGGSMLWSDRRFGMFSQILSGPFTRTEYLAGIIGMTTATSLVGAVIMLLIAIPLGTSVYFSFAGLGLVFINLVVGGIFFCSLMLSVAGRVDSNNTYNSIQILIIFIINFISDVFYPVNGSTPLPLRLFSYINPLTYITDGIRAGLGNPNSFFSVWNPIELLVLLVETLVMFLVAYRTYSTAKVATS
jgi:ABC-2 type transport system permease protein